MDTHESPEEGKNAAPRNPGLMTGMKDTQAGEIRRIL
jgi:hypothetical protein